MREVTLFWKRERLVKDRVAFVTDIFEKIVFIGYLERTPKNVVTIMRGICKEGCTPLNLNEHKDYEVEEILSEPNNLDPAWMFVLNIKHPLTLLAAKVGKLTAKPGSCLNQEGLHYTLRGSPISIKIILTAARMMLKPDKVKGTGITQTDFQGNQLLTEQQMRVLTAAFELGWYEIPRGCKIDDIAEEVGLARATVQEHLVKAEHTIMKHFLYGDPYLDDDEEENGKK